MSDHPSEMPTAASAAQAAADALTSSGYPIDAVLPKYRTGEEVDEAIDKSQIHQDDEWNVRLVRSMGVQSRTLRLYTESLVDQLVQENDDLRREIDGLKDEVHDQWKHLLALAVVFLIFVVATVVISVWQDGIPWM